MTAIEDLSRLFAIFTHEYGHASVLDVLGEEWRVKLHRNWRRDGMHQARCESHERRSVVPAFIELPSGEFVDRVNVVKWVGVAGVASEYIVRFGYSVDAASARLTCHLDTVLNESDRAIASDISPEQIALCCVYIAHRGAWIKRRALRRTLDQLQRERIKPPA